MKTVLDRLKNAATVAVLSSTLFGDSDSNVAEAAQIQANFSGRVATASGPGGGPPQGNFYPEQDVTLNVTFNDAALAEPGGTANFNIFGEDAFESATFSSGPYNGHDLLTLPASNFVTLTNQTDPNAIIGDAFMARIEGPEFSIVVDLFAFFPNIIPGPIAIASLEEALQNLEGFNQGGFNISDQFGGTASGSFHTISITNIASADFNRNGTVDQQDLLLWQNNYGATSGAIADADGDGDADGRDFLAWQRQVNVGSVQALIPAVTAVPEPQGFFTALSACAISAGSFLSRYIRELRR